MKEPVDRAEVMATARGCAWVVALVVWDLGWALAANAVESDGLAELCSWIAGGTAVIAVVATGVVRIRRGWRRWRP